MRWNVPSQGATLLMHAPEASRHHQTGVSFTKILPLIDGNNVWLHGHLFIFNYIWSIQILYMYMQNCERITLSKLNAMCRASPLFHRDR